MTNYYDTPYLLDFQNFMWCVFNQPTWAEEYLRRKDVASRTP